MDFTQHFQGEVDYGYSSASWLPTGLNDGNYELIVHVLCEPSGLSFPPMGIDESYSSIVSGVCVNNLINTDFNLLADH